MSRVRRIRRWAGLVFAGVVMLLVWVLLVLVASRPALKKLWDCSPQAIFTVSPATETLLTELQKGKVKVEFHTFLYPLSPAPPEDPFQRQQWQILSRLHQLTIDVLRQYAFLGGESVKVKHHDVRRPSDETNAAVKRFNAGGSSDVVGTVVIATGGRHKRLSLEGDLAVIHDPRIQQSRSGMPSSELPTLKDFKGEEALSSALKSLLVQGRPVLYFLKGHREREAMGRDMQANDGYGRFRAALEQEGFELRELELASTDVVPQDANLIACLEPQVEFSEREAELLYGYLRRGGHLFLNYAFLGIDGLDPTGGPLGRLLGFEVGTRQVVHLVPTENGSGRGDTPEVQRLVIRDWSMDTGEKTSGVLQGLNKVHPIGQPLARAARVPELTLGRELTLTNPRPANVVHEPLLRTGPAAWLAASGPEGMPSWRPPGRGEYGSRLLGAVIEVDGEKKDVTGRAVVVSAAAFNNMMYGYNGDLGLNIMNWLVERKELVTVRGSSYVARFLKVSAEQIGRIQWLLMGGVPFLFAVLGFAVWWRRSRGR